MVAILDKRMDGWLCPKSRSAMNGFKRAISRNSVALALTVLVFVGMALSAIDIRGCFGGCSIARNRLLEQFQLFFICSGKFDPVTGFQRKEIFAIDMRFHFPYQPDIDNG